MATRMQQRRGTAAQWISTNSGNGPILAAGEIGFESDTNKFKVGDGINHWINLDYFVDANSTTNPSFGSSITFEGATDNAFETTIQVTDPTADRTITFPDATGTVVLADGSGNVTVSGDLTVSGTTTTINSTTINATTGIVFEGLTANAFETTLAVTDPTADRTLTLPDETGTIATQGYVDTAASNATFDASLAAGTGLDWNAGTEQFDVDTTTIATKTYVDNLSSNHILATTSVHGIANTADLATTTATASAISTAVADHTVLTTSIHGISNTADLATKTYADTAVSTHNGDSTNVHGIADTADLATKSYADTAVQNHAAITTSVHGIADTDALATKSYADTAVSTHNSDTTNIHGISDTADLVTLSGTQTLSNKTLTGPTITIPSATTTLYSHTAGQIFVVSDQIIDPPAIVLPSSQLSSAGWPTDPSYYVGKTLVISGANNAAYNGSYTTTSAVFIIDSIYLRSSLIATKSHGQVGYPTLTLQETTAEKTISSTEIGYIDGVTSAIQTQIDAKAPLVNPTFTGTVTLPTGTVTSGMIANGTIVDADINASAAIAQSKISGLTTDLDAKLALAGGTMTGALTLSAAPTSDLHAATKLYVDNVTAGINFHQAVHVATTANLSADYSNGTGGIGATLTGSVNGAWPTIDGHSSFTQYDRVLVKNQTDAKQNGIYILSDLGSAGSKWILTRASDADNNPTGEMKTGDFVLTLNGGQAGYGFVNNSTANPIAIGTDNITYTEFNAAKTIVAGNGLQEATPGTLSIDTAITATVSNLDLKAPIASPTFTGTVTVAASGIAFTDGTQTKEGVASRTPIIQKDQSYTLSALTERDSLIEMNGSASPITLTIPAESSVNYPVGTSIDILSTGSQQVTIAGAGGVTVNATPGLKLRAQWSSATLFKRAADTWVVMGDLSA